MGVLFIHKMLVVISHEKVVLMYGGVIYSLFGSIIGHDIILFVSVWFSQYMVVLIRHVVVLSSVIN